MHESSSLFVDTAVGQALLPASPLNQFSQPLSTVRHRHRRLPSVTPTGRKCPPQPHPEAAVPPAMALFGLRAAGTPAVGGRGALQAPLGSGPSWSQGAGHLLRRGLSARMPDGAGHPSTDRRMSTENLPRAGPGNRSPRLSLRGSPFFRQFKRKKKRNPHQ